MDKLKLYAAPLVALILILAWYFLVRPKLNDGALDDEKADKADKGPAGKPLPKDQLPPEPTDPAQRVQ